MFGPRNGKRSWAVRAAVLAGAIGALVLGAASTASADPMSPATNSGKLTYKDLNVGLWDTTAEDAKNPSKGEVPVAQFSLDINGQPTMSYCIDINHGSDNGGTYNEAQWKDASAKDLGRIQWILTNSYPNVSAVSDLLTKAGATLTGSTSELDKVAYVGTQAAIWHNSDGFKLDTKTSKGLSADQFTAVQKLYSYLVGNAVEAAPPAPTLSFTAPSVTSGPVGSKVGPFTVNTTAKSVTLSATNGGKVVDKDGNAITTLADGGQFWVEQTKAGGTSVTASGEGTVPAGRVFLAARGANKYQEQILAGSAPAAVKATVAVTTSTASPTPSASASGTGAGSTLPVTGTSLTWIVVAAVVLLGGGAALFMVSRRRRTTQ